MQRLRFPTAVALFDAFPTAAADVGEAVEDLESIAYMRKLDSAGKLIGALTFCSYLLPRREAVHWGCISVRALPGALSIGERACVESAERWVTNPEEGLRFDAGRAALAGDQTAPATFAAYAAGYAGRMLVPAELGAAPVPEQLTAQSIRCLFLLSKMRVAEEAQETWFRARLELGIQLATGEDRG